MKPPMIVALAVDKEVDPMPVFLRQWLIALKYANYWRNEAFLFPKIADLSVPSTILVVIPLFGTI